MTEDSPAIARASELLAKLRVQIGNALVGHQSVVDQTLIALLVAGHVLLEGVPGSQDAVGARARTGPGAEGGARAIHSRPHAFGHYRSFHFGSDDSRHASGARARVHEHFIGG